MNSPLFKFVPVLDYYKLLVPDNGEIEKQKFKTSWNNQEKYNPQHIYSALSEKNYEDVEIQIQVHKAQNPILDIFVDLFSKISNVLASLQQHNYIRVTSLTGELFGDVKEFDLQKLIDLQKLSQTKIAVFGANQTNQSYTGAELVIKFQDKINEYDLSDWAIEQDPKRLSDVTIDASNKKIIINPARKISEVELTRLLEHEIKGHIFQGENSSNYDLYQDLFSCYLGNEQQSEGFALFVEVNNLDDLVFWNIINRYTIFMITNHIALTNDFYRTFSFIFDISNDFELSYLAALRSKRGFEDTSNIGCFQKENSYLIGLTKVINLALNQPEKLEQIKALKFPLGYGDLFFDLNNASVKYDPIDLIVTHKLSVNLKVLQNVIILTD